MKVNILGTKYKIHYRDEEQDPVLEKSDGYCDKTSKEIVVLKLTKDNSDLKKREEYVKKVTRHEIVHAFLFESGLAEGSLKSGNWATNEELVDWIAYQSPKMFKAFQQAECL